jgi:hypothetical protein
MMQKVIKSDTSLLYAESSHLVASLLYAAPSHSCQLALRKWGQMGKQVMRRKPAMMQKVVKLMHLFCMPNQVT